MEPNVGFADRIVRAFVGFAILMLLPVTMWGWLGLIPLMSGLLGQCPVYALLHINTCGRPRGT